MRHAYLIMSHDNFYNLKKLLSLLDAEFNDIYLHIDKKVENFNFNEYKNICKKSNIFFVDRTTVYWGTYSQVEAQINLLKVAVSKKYSYYHFLSGSDLPIKEQEYIYNFFNTNSGKEFLGFAKEYNNNYISKNYYLVKFFRNKNFFISYFAKKISAYIVNIQKILDIDKTKKYNLIIKKGTDWYSITHKSALYLIEQEVIFKKLFNKSLHPGEFFAHTILFNSHFKDNIYNLVEENEGSLRLIDWDRGKPYIFREEDYNEIMNSKQLFARKFNERTDKKIIDMIFNRLKKDLK